MKNEMKKFEILSGNKKNWNGITLYQIKATTNFITSSGIEIRERELGGWIEKEENLSQEGKAWVFENAKIYGEAKISDNAEIWGETQICGNAKISSPNNLLNITPVGKYKVSLTLFKTKNNSIEISYNWKLYTLEEFDPVMSDWTKEEQKIVKAAIEILGG